MSPKETFTAGPLARTVIAFAPVLALALAAVTTAPAAGGPIIVAPGGCALQCIQKALVSSIATAARVELGTIVPAKVVVTARRLAGNGVPVAGPPRPPPRTTPSGPNERSSSSASSRRRPT